jgi:hypothetical protein
MHRFLIRLSLGVLFVALVHPALAGSPPSSAEQGAIRAVIESQLAAFRSDDDVRAFAYASPTIRARFGTPEVFMTMVRDGYQAVYRARQVEFRELRLIDGTPVQEVLLVGPDDRPSIAAYVMELQADGSWKINGVYLLRSPETTT